MILCGYYVRPITHFLFLADITLYRAGRFIAMCEAARRIVSDDFTPKIWLIISGKKEKHRW